jgi:hypothetical protein
MTIRRPFSLLPFRNAGQGVSCTERYRRACELRLALLLEPLRRYLDQGEANEVK